MYGIKFQNLLAHLQVKCRGYKEKYPLVQITLRTGTADAIQTRMNKGLVDIGLFMKPVWIQTGRLQIDVRRFFFSS